VGVDGGGLLGEMKPGERREKGTEKGELEAELEREETRLGGRGLGRKDGTHEEVYSSSIDLRPPSVHSSSL